MKRLCSLLLLSGALATPTIALAEERGLSTDTLKTFNMDEIVVTSSTKETNKLRTRPASVSILTPQQINARQITSIKDISSFVPNLYMPDYGAKLTSAIYIRGIGTRGSGQSVGLYVNNVPYMDKSSFDFNLTDIKNIEVLRGPQGTLYGRNAMGGIINIQTLSPFDFQGIKGALSYGNYEQVDASLSGYTRLSDAVGLSAGAYYSRSGGFFTNAYDNKKIDEEETFGGNINLSWQVSPKLTASYSAYYEHTDQGAFPYGLYNEATNTVGQVNMNDESSYKRSMISNNLSLSYRNESILLTSTTGYQYLDDDMKMDQDFSDASVFVLNQLQKQHAFSEEISIKSQTESNYQWSFGAFGFYNKLDINAPVEFRQDGIQSVFQSMFNNMGITVTNNSLPIPGDFNTPSYGAALYHQSTYNNLFTKGLSLTAGVRLDYEKQELDYYSKAKMNLSMSRGPGMPPQDISDMYPESVIDEHLSQALWQVLPKVSLKYECTPRTFTYLSAAKGYKAGGYNVQMSADIMQDQMRYDVMNAFSAMMPPTVVIEEPGPIEPIVTYKPETSWNYEIGVKSELVKNRLHSELTFFYTDVEDVQITQFVASGSGRILSNAGKAESYGAEVSLRAILHENLTADLNYGYTHATFSDYNNNVDDFKGNNIPYTPKHTLSVGLQYNKTLRNSFIDQWFASAQCNGAGKIYWTEENTLSQPFYAVVNARAGVRRGAISLNLWARNLTDTAYSTFYFNSFDKSFMQKGKPLQFGAKINFAF